MVISMPSPLRTLCYLVVLSTYLTACEQKPIQREELFGTYVARGHVPRGGSGSDYFELKPDGTYVRYLKATGQEKPCLSNGTWSRSQLKGQDHIVLDGFNWAPWQIPPGFPPEITAKTLNKPGISIAQLDRYKGTLRLRFMSDVNYYFVKE